MKPKARERSISPALQLLHKLCPPDTIVHVGAGTGAGPLHQWQQWQVPQAWLIDADATRLLWLQKQPQPGWRAVTAALAEQSSRRSFLHASNPDESSLLPLELLQSLWPNLQGSAVEEQQTTTLDQLLQEELFSAQAPWLIVDCLPALPILQGASQLLQSCQVLWVRALLEDHLDTAEGVSLAAMEPLLQTQGFVRVDLQPANHPALAYALFARNWHAELVEAHKQLQQYDIAQGMVIREFNEKFKKLEYELAATARAGDERARLAIALTEARDQQSKLATNLQAQLEQATNARDEQAKLAAERQQQLEVIDETRLHLEQAQVAQASELEELQKQVAVLTQTRDEQIKLAVERKAQLEQVSKVRDEQGKLATERLGLLEQASKARDEQVKLAAERQQQLEAVTKAKAVLEQDMADQASKLEDQQKQLVALTQVRDQQAKLAAERQAQLEQVCEARDEQARLASERQQQVAALTHAKATLEQEKTAQATTLDELQKQTIVLTQARDQQAKLAAERQAQLEQVSKACEEQANLASNQKAQLDQMSKGLDAQNAEAIQLRQSLDESRMFLKDTEARLAEMKAELLERDTRQQMLSDEITRAEAQIDLIKDVLLREPGL